jgi:hypothetical protein
MTFTGSSYPSDYGGSSYAGGGDDYYGDQYNGTMAGFQTGRTDGPFKYMLPGDEEFLADMIQNPFVNHVANNFVRGGIAAGGLTAALGVGRGIYTRMA